MDPEAQSPQGLERNAEPQRHPPMAGLSTHVREVGGARETLCRPPKHIHPCRLQRTGSKSCTLSSGIFCTGCLQFQANTLFPSWKHHRAWPCVNHSPYHILFPSSLGRQTQVEILSGLP